jgi:hypothetical protein
MQSGKTPHLQSERRGDAVRKALISLALLLAGAACADDGSGLKNWFGDPFFRLVEGVPNCPTPLGPLQTESEMKSESHSRAERGTTCWMSGACSQPNAYLYDPEIAKLVREKLRVEGDASLWVTVKRRFVWVEGCVTRAGQAAELENQVKALPDVERVFVNVMTGAAGKPPYRTLPEATR